MIPKGTLLFWFTYKLFSNSDVVHGPPDCEGMLRGIFAKLRSCNLQKVLNQPLEVNTGEHFSTLINDTSPQEWYFHRLQTYEDSTLQWLLQSLETFNFYYHTLTEALLMHAYFWSGMWVVFYLWINTVKIEDPGHIKAIVFFIFLMILSRWSYLILIYACDAVSW